MFRLLDDDDFWRKFDGGVVVFEKVKCHWFVFFCCNAKRVIQSICYCSSEENRDKEESHFQDAKRR